MNERHAVFATVALFLVPVVVAVGFNIALGYDEAVYAGFARQLVTGDPADGWGIHRPPGLSIIGTVPMFLGLSTESSLRLIGVVAGVGLVATCWWASRRLGGPIAGMVAAVGIAAASPVQVESASFLTDVPATALLVTTATLMWRSVTTRPAWASIASIGVLAAAGFYMRYGSLVAIAALGAAILVAAPRQVAERAGRSASPSSSSGCCSCPISSSRRLRRGRRSESSAQPSGRPAGRRRPSAPTSPGIRGS